MTLSDEIRKHRADIRSDGYPMSVGELISLYRNRELEVRPAFQRFFRWTDAQKSSLIESLLLGIPIPSVFVSQREDGVWDVIDGQQRLSTIFELVGVLRREDGTCATPLTLTETRYLNELGGKTWDGNGDDGIGRDNQLLIKRSKIDVKIILRESSEGSKYELFQRLNTGGSQLSRQEIRNVIAITVDPDFYDWTETLAGNDNFKLCTSLSDRLLEERYDLELVMRFLILGRVDDSRLRIGDLGNFLDRESERLAGSREFDRQKEEHIFSVTFRELAKKYGDDIFRRFDKEKDRHLGGFVISAFEAFAMGLSWHVRNNPVSAVEIDEGLLQERVKSTWSDEEFTKAIGSGKAASSRIPIVIPYARRQLEECISAMSRS